MREAQRQRPGALETRLGDQRQRRETEAAEGGDTFPGLLSRGPHSDPYSGFSAKPHFTDAETEAQRGFRSSQLVSGWAKTPFQNGRSRAHGLPTPPPPQH